ncbi:MAG: flagellar hook-associated protein FlgK [Verrucomicrobia bacterium]|nr:flagellar hook-associated protein FlgK [Verrucomicrobiota bacterium]
MAGLISALHNSSGAIRVHSKGLEIAGKNLANINNRDYAKQRVEIGDRGQIDTGIATESMGVEAMGLRQNRDALLDKAVMRELNASSDLTARQTVLQNAETALGQFLDRTKDSTSIQNAPSSNGGGISDALSDFFNAWESFSVKPNDVGEKQLLIAKAEILTEKINLTDARLSRVQSDVDEQLKVDVGIVNQLLAEIAKTNEYIARAELVKPYSAVDLRDQRQAKLEELAQYIDVQFENIPDGLGQIKVTMRNGADVVTLVDGKDVPGQTFDTNDAAVGPFDYSTDFPLGSGKRSFLHNGTVVAINDLAAGKLKGQLEISTGRVDITRSEIGKLATQLTDSVNGLFSPIGQVFFKNPPSGGLLIELNGLTVDQLKASTTTGGNQIALAIAALASKRFDTTGASPNLISGTYTAFFNKTVTTVAQDLNSTRIRLEDQKLSEEMARNSREQFSGVSQDEEVTDMMKFQRSFQASARHINVIDTLLEQVVNRLGVG